MIDGPRGPRVFFDGLRTTPRLDHPEGIAVAPDGAVWCGGEAGQIYRIHDGAIEQIATTGGFCLGITLDRGHHLYACDLIHAAVFRLDTRTGELERFADGAGGTRLQTPNAAVVDAEGHLIVTDSGEPHRPAPGLFRFAPGGTGQLWSDEPLNFANGAALSPDGRTLYVVETWARRITAFAVHEHRNLGERTTLAQLPGVVPDGVATDPLGRVWVACYEPSQIIVVSSDGGHAVVAADPDGHLLCHPTNLAFLDGEVLATNLGRWHLTAIDIKTADALGP